MALNNDSPKRRSLRLQGKSDDNVTPASRGPSGPQSGRRTSGPRTRQSGGSSSATRSQRRSKGQKIEDPIDNSRGGSKGVGVPGKSGSSGATTEGQVQGGAPDEKPEGKTIKTRRSLDGLQDNGGLSCPEPKKDGGLTLSMVSQQGNDAGEARSSQESKERSQETVGQIKDVALEVKASLSKSKTKDGETDGPSVEKMRDDVVEAGPSGVCSVASSEVAEPSRPSTSKNNENPNISIISPSRRRVYTTKSPVRNTDRGTSDPASSSAPPRDSRVQCTSKQLLQEVLEMCAEFSKEILESQSYLTPEQRQQEHKNFMWNFETALQDNVSINGQPWHEASDTPSEPDLKILEDQLDDAIVDVAMKRKRYPKKILCHFVKGLKLEREILSRYKPVVEPKEFNLDSRSESSMTEQTTTIAAISRHIKETMKALPAQLEKAEGFSQVLNLQPVLQGSRLRQDIFSSQTVPQNLKTEPKVVETTPNESMLAATMAPVRNVRKRPSIQSNLYPLRSKRKISLEG